MGSLVRAPSAQHLAAARAVVADDAGWRSAVAPELQPAVEDVIDNLDELDTRLLGRARDASVSAGEHEAIEQLLARRIMLAELTQRRVHGGSC